MFRWYVVNTYSGHENKVKQNLEHRVVSLNQKRAVRQVVVPTETVSEMKDNQKITVEKRTMPGYVLVNMELNEDSWALVKGTPGRHRLRRRVQRAGPAHPGRGRPPAAPRGRRQRPREPRAVLDRRVGQGRLRPAVGLLRRDLGDQRGRGAAQGACVNLRPRDAGRSRLRPGQEDLERRWPRRVLTTHQARRPVAARPARRRRSAPRWASTASTSWSSARRSTRRPSDIGHDDPRRHHRLRGPLVHVRHEDAAGRRAHQAGHRHREGLGRAATATRSARSRQTQVRADRRAQAPRPQRPRPSTRRPRSSPAPPARWAWRSWPDGQARQDLPRGPRARSTASTSTRPPRRSRWSRSCQAREVRRVRRGPRPHRPQRPPRRRAAARHDRAAQRPRQGRHRRRLRPGRQGARRPRRPAPTSSAPRTSPSASRRASPTSTSRSRRPT